MKKHDENKLKRVEKLILRILNPIADIYRTTRRGLHKFRISYPLVYNEMEKIVKSQLVTLKRSEYLIQKPDFDEFAKVLTERVAERMPNVNKEKLNKIVQSASSQSFLDTLAQGIETTAGREVEYTKIRKRKLFKKILVANRGEIAIRIIRACRELGIKVVVVYSKPDKESLAVKFADETYNIGDVKSYLDTHKIIKIAKKANAGAIHPGYGFLSENANFAKLCVKNKIKFIGPSVRAMQLMGDKVKAKETVSKLGIPVIEGTARIKNEHQALEIADTMGYPIIIKASMGGGGKGMKVVRRQEKLSKAFQAAQAEAEASFGDKAVYIEKYIEEPRHVEFQILGDSHGNIIHLGERDCSIQRRHQKLVEESPSPALNNEVRKKLGEAAVKIAKAVNYEGAGTVEFLLDKKGNFYFIEMNTRIQVEHGVTEMVTGVDLVKEQIKIAAGAKLTYKQEDIKLVGHAIECRINAECPTEGFCPMTGTISQYLPPGGPGIRVCSSAFAGQVVSPYYDSLIAKLMCSGKTRQEAIDRMKRALNEFVIEGVDTTMPFHKAVLSSKAFMKGDIDTKFIKKNSILEELRRYAKPKKKGLPREVKRIVVTTAVSKYLEKHGRSFPGNRMNNWVTTSRQEGIQESTG